MHYKKLFKQLSWCACTLALLLTCVMWAAADTPRKLSAVETQYETLRLEYFRLRNTDPQLSDMRAWRAMGEKLQQYVSKNPRSSRAPDVLLHRSHLFEQIYLHSNADGDRRQSLQSLTQVLNDYAVSELADDALFRSAQIMERLFHDREAARQIYARLPSRYPQSEYVADARQHVARISRKEPLDEPQRAREPARAHAAGWMVVLDPGHGGEDFGAKGPRALLEKDVVLAIALEAERLLEGGKKIAGKPVVVELTRRADEFVPLAERTRLANAWNADVFVSLHNNASEDGTLSGVQTFYLDAAGDEASRLLAERENGAGVLEGGGGDLALMLSDLTQSAKQGPSIALAHVLQDAVLERIRTEIPNAKAMGVRPAPFYVLVGVHAPGVLSELFFIDHELDGRRLATRQFRSLLAQGVAKGVRAYLDQYGNSDVFQ